MTFPWNPWVLDLSAILQFLLYRHHVLVFCADFYACSTKCTNSIYISTCFYWIFCKAAGFIWNWHTMAKCWMCSFFLLLSKYYVTLLFFKVLAWDSSNNLLLSLVEFEGVTDNYKDWKVRKKFVRAIINGPVYISIWEVI